jgi:hypothetical protein
MGDVAMSATATFLAFRGRLKSLKSGELNTARYLPCRTSRIGGKLDAQQKLDLMMEQTTHEVFSRDEKVVPGSDRSFGLVMAAPLTTVTLLSFWHAGRLWLWTSGPAALFLVAGLLRPSVLHSLNLLWLRFGLLLHRVVNPIVMALLFYGTVLPTGLVMRMMGKDPLRLKQEPEADSYWIARQPPGPSPETMKDQF